MAKYYVIQMTDGSRWEIPAQLIAEDKAKHRASSLLKKDGTPYQETYDETLEETLNDEEELTDWARNNIRWPDVQAAAVKIKDAPAADYEYGWHNGDTYIYDKPAP